MTACVALLRGINVGRAKRIAMADLRALLEGLGHSGVRTLLNSGNAVFETKVAGTAAARAIERAIESELALSVAVVVVAAGELATIVRENPLRQATTDPSRCLVAFVQRAQALAPARPLLTQPWGADALAFGSKAAYLWCANGMIKSKLASAFARATRDTTTMRNWATVLKLQAMLAEG